FIQTRSGDYHDCKFILGAALLLLSLTNEGIPVPTAGDDALVPDDHQLALKLSDFRCCPGPVKILRQALLQLAQLKSFAHVTFATIGPDQPASLSTFGHHTLLAPGFRHAITS